MKYTLLEHKFILQEQKFILNEELDETKINNALKLVKNAQENLNNNSPFNIKTVDNDFKAYKDFLNKTKTTSNYTSDETGLKTALSKFWNTVQNNILPLQADEIGNEVFKLLKQYKGVIKDADKVVNATDLVTPNENGKEIKKKFLLKTAIEVENMFDKILPMMKSDSELGASDPVVKSYLNFLEKSLKIFITSWNDLNDDNKTALEKLLDSITEASLADKDSLNEIINDLNSLNTKIKNSGDAEKQQARQDQYNQDVENWDSLYKKMEENQFWDKYFKEYWTDRALDIMGFGTAYKNECKVYGFTEKTNPFISYIKYLFNTLNIPVNGSQYQVIHNAVADRSVSIDEIKLCSKYKNKNDELLNEIDNRLSIIYCINLFKKKAAAMKDYISTRNKLVARNAGTKTGTILYSDQANQEHPFVYGHLRELSDIVDRAAREGYPIDGGSPDITPTDIRNIIEAHIKNDTLLKAGIQYFLVLLDDPDTVDYRNRLQKLGWDVNNLATLKDVINFKKLISNYNMTDSSAKKFLNDLISRAEAKQAVTKQTA